MSQGNSSTAIQTKYEDNLGTADTLTINDILWLDNLAYFRTMPLKSKYINNNVRDYLDDIKDETTTDAIAADVVAGAAIGVVNIRCYYSR